MQKLATLIPSEGEKDFSEFLEFLSDKDRYDARLKALQKVRDEVNNSMAIKHNLNQTETMRTAAELDAKAAAKYLGDANEKANGIMQQARDDASVMKAETDAKSANLVKLVNSHEQRVAKCNEKEKSLIEREGELQKDRSRANDRFGHAEAMLEKAEEMKKTYTDKLKAMKALSP